MEILAPISVGELIDKITILRLKAERLTDPVKLANVGRELSRLEALADDLPQTPEFADLTARLQALNAVLWDIEDAKRRHEREGRFDAEFVALARQVYLRNDERAALRRALSVAAGSAIVEEKSHG
ncbi:DUF6165 family protein [Brevundimonas sp.]|uniref:DUF6165 family protein n=1 Tax=Brevundimonas sp. TaxID=1871086 RepID=UPI0025F86D2B|nr:DUF6165 family protein [Brevundimonas sp.]